MCALAAPAGMAVEIAGSDAVIRSGAEIDYPPFSMVNDRGEADGFSVELMRAALAAMGRGVSFRTGPWAQVRGWLERGDVQALPLVGRTPEREALFDFTVPYMTLHGAIVVRDGETGIRDLADLRGRQVAVMKGDNAEEFLRRKDRGIHIHTTPTFEAALRELSEGRYDAVVIQRLVALRLIQKTGLTDLRVVEQPIDGFRQDFCFAVHEGDRDTLALLNEGLAIVMADGTYRHLHAKWFAALQLPSDARIVVGGDHAYPPFEYLDENGRPAGYNVALTRAIAAEMGLDIEIRLGPWAEIVKGMEEKRIHVIQGMFYLPERDLKFDFTQPHTVGHYVSVVRSGDGEPPSSLDDLAGKRVVVQRGDAAYDFLMEKGLGGRLSLAETQEDVLRELAEGKQDCALAVRISSLYLIEKNGWNNLVLGRQAFLPLEYCYAAPNGHKAVLAQFSEGLKVLEKSGEYRRIYEKWLGVYQEEPPSLWTALRYSALVLLALLLLALAAFAWSWALRRQVAEKTRALKESLDRFQYVFEAANVGKSLTLPTGEVNANKAFADFLGYSPDELKGLRWQDLTPAEDVETIEKAIAPMLAGEQDAVHFEKRYVHKSGAYKWADVSSAMRRDQNGNPVYFMTTVVDISARKEAEAALRASEEYQRAMIACSPVALYTVDPDGKVISWNRSAERIFGWRAEEIMGRPLPIVPEDKRREFDALRRQALEKGGFFGKELMRLKKDGSLFPVSLSAAPVRNDRGEMIGILGAAEDITERKISEERLRNSESRFRLFAELAPVGIVISDENENTLYASRKFTELFGYTFEDMPSVKEWWPLAYPDEAMRIRVQREWQAAVGEARRSHTETKPMAYPVTCKDGTVRHIEFRMAAAGSLNVVVFTDVTERKEAEAEKEKLQSQLLQAQKMESIGRLAGGVAHDYNNMLSVIIGYAEMALDKTASDPSLRRDLTEILGAARRSSDITRQLLAFARRQPIAPRALELNRTVEAMLKMLRRLIGEDIDLSWQPGPGPVTVFMDPTQLDQLLANLCVNARDAIAGVGKLTIETGPVHFDAEYCAQHAGFSPGPFILLAVSDDGHGMDKETLEKIFEPFFTTKGLGEGTGLGLATVFGIVKQNDGFINVYSEPQKGTTFKIYLPPHAAEPEGVKRPEVSEIPMGRGETVLIVEDERSILDLAKTIMERLGYAVLAASSPAEALSLAQDSTLTIDLLVTDVVMPEMNGTQLAEALRVTHPNLNVLFMSGYTANVIVHRGVLDDGVNFIQKPFSRRDLAVKARQALEAGHRAD